MTNSEVKSLWEASGRKARVDLLSNDGHWYAVDDPEFVTALTYRINPDDMHLCMPRICSKHQERDPECPLCNSGKGGTEPAKPDPWAHAKSILDADTAGKAIEVRLLDGRWIEIRYSLDSRTLGSINSPDDTRVAHDPQPKQKVMVHFFRHHDGSIGGATGELEFLKSSLCNGKYICSKEVEL